MSYEQLLREARANPYVEGQSDEVSTSQAGALVAPIYAVGRGLYSGVIEKPAEALGQGLVLGAEAIDSVGNAVMGTEGDSWATKKLKGYLDATTRNNILARDDISKQGVINSTLYGLGDVLGTFASVAMTGGASLGLKATAGAVGAIQGNASFQEGKAEGLDTNTALMKGAIEGAAIGVGSVIPFSMGFKLTPIAEATFRGIANGVWNSKGMFLKDVAYTAGANMAVGVGSRGATHEILAQNGYQTMADQYMAYDEQALFLDGALGLIFGGVAKGGELYGISKKAISDGVASKKGAALASELSKEMEAKREQISSPKYAEAILEEKNKLHQIDVAPGLAVDPLSMKKHTEAMGKALDDIMAGDIVDVADIVDGATFMRNPNHEYIDTFNSVVHELYPDEAMFFTEKGDQVKNRDIATLKKEILAERDHPPELANAEIIDLNNGFIPDRLIPRASELTGIPEGALKERLKFHDTTEAPNLDNIVSDAEFSRMQENTKASEGITDELSAVDHIVDANPDLEIPILNADGTESLVKMSDAVNMARADLGGAEQQSKIYKAAIACLMGVGKR